jgi:P4 family phage/plasmid primase-like protien
MLEWALRYLRLGWPVIPLRGKIPLTENGSRDATLNESQVRAWWTQWPDANVGLATGHGWFAIDVDVKGGGQETWDMLRSQYVRLPDTPEQITGTGGRHILFRAPADFTVRNSQGKLGPGIDVRGEGGYIVACPSVHPETGRRYDWDGLKDLEDTPIAPAPPWLVVLLREAQARASTPEPAPATIAEGQRNSTLFKEACRLRRMAWSEQEILASLRAINRGRCHPPLPEAELTQIAESAARYRSSTRANLLSGASPPADLGGEPELPVTESDIEVAVAQAIAQNDLLSAVNLAPNVARLKVHSQTLIKLKLRQHFGREFPARDFERSVREAVQHGSNGHYDPPAPRDPDGKWPDLRQHPLTDSGNAERLLAMFRAELRYCIEMRKWLVWDGRRWMVDDAGMASQYAKRMCRELYAQAIGNDVLSKFARKSESHAGISAMLNRASTEPGVPVAARELDQQPYLFNCPNGVVDLRTGELVPHDRGLLITKLCKFAYRPKAECPRFLAFLQWAMGQNPEADLSERTVRMLAFLQRAFGYSLTADVSEKCAFICYGDKGNNGKTTLLTLFKNLVGEYAAQISIDTLMVQRGSADAALRADMADLRGARFVITSEVEEQHKLSEGKLKYITAGQGEIKSCRKYENPIEFEATHKLWMDCNHRPRVTGTDEAIWSRLKCIPFEVRIEREDPEFDLKLKEKLESESEGILAWAVRGAMRWFDPEAAGLGQPPEVGQANVEWREHDDPLKQFLEDACEIEKDAWCQSAVLTAAYAHWCRREHEKYPLTREKFHERMKAKGFQMSRSRRSSDGRQLRSTEGVRVKDDFSKQMNASGDPWRGLAD